MKTEKITAEYLTRIFEDERVLGGLERAMDITHGKGLETAFRVYKRPCSDLFYPDDHIEIGCPLDAGGDSGTHYAEELYRVETGKDPCDEDNTEDYIEFSMRNTLDREFIFPNVQMQRGDYPLLNFHVRREGRRTHSKSDLDNLKYVMENYPYARPISCVVSSEQDYPLFLLQATTSEWENLDINFFNRMHSFLAKADYDNKESFLFLQALLISVTKKVNPFVTGSGNYERGLKRFTFYPNMFFPFLNRFEYENEVEEE